MSATSGARGFGAGPLARAYDRLIGPGLAAQVMPVCEALLFPGLPAGAALLELGCGTGQVAQALIARGFQVTGLDLAVGMLAHAVGNAPRGRFLAADMRCFVLPPLHDAGLVIGSLSYLAGADDLAAVFANVHHALRPGASFLLEVFLAGSGGGSGGERLYTHLGDDLVVVVRETRAASGRHSTTAMTIFHRDADGGSRGDGAGAAAAPGTWQRWDDSWQETYHAAEEICAALTAAGFAAPRFHDGARDLGRPELAERTYVVARR
jgi:SAM-dependent methyltransferase